MNRTLNTCVRALLSSALLLACREKSSRSNSEAIAPSGPSPETSEVAARKPESPAVEATFEFRGPGQHLPKAVGAFRVANAPRYFDRSNLYNLINGGSEVYISLGLKEMVTADYTSKDKPKVTVTVEIYDMASPKNASARFQKFLAGWEDPSSAGKGLPDSMTKRGLLGSANASFWKEQYLVNVTVLDESDSASKETMTLLGAQLLPEFARSIDDTI